MSPEMHSFVFNETTMHISISISLSIGVILMHSSFCLQVPSAPSYGIERKPVFSFSFCYKQTLVAQMTDEPT